MDEMDRNGGPSGQNGPDVTMDERICRFAVLAKSPGRAVDPLRLWPRGSRC
jgi:hypothetical protein